MGDVNAIWDIQIQFSDRYLKYLSQIYPFTASYSCQ